MSSINVWTQWDDLITPASINLLSPKNFSLDSSDLSLIDFYVPVYMGGAKALSYAADMPRLKVLQLLNAGYDDALAYQRPGLTICNAKGVHDASTAELAVGLAIATRRNFPEFMQSQIAESWNHKETKSLTDCKIGIIGYGSIGRKIAQNLSGFEVSITAFTRSGRDGSLAIEELDSLLPNFDIVILILPLSESSRKLFNAKRLAKMKDGALLINVARGPVVDTDALVKELNSERIYAALDVTDPEPLPKGHPLWQAKNLLLVPHIGGHSTAFEPRGRALIESQIKLFAAGAPLEHVVNQG